MNTSLLLSALLARPRGNERLPRVGPQARLRGARGAERSGSTREAHPWSRSGCPKCTCPAHSRDTGRVQLGSSRHLRVNSL
jgi:hypothetical protein